MTLATSDSLPPSSELPRRNEIRRTLTDAVITKTWRTRGDFRPLGPQFEASNPGAQTGVIGDTIMSQTLADYKFAQPIHARIINPVVDPPVTTLPRPDAFVVLQQWEASVLEVRPDGFIARLEDKSADRPSEEAEFPMEEVSAMDRDLIAPGAVFYWSIGYRDKPSGQRSRESVIRFRRLPAWTARELQKVRDEAKELRDQLVDD